MKTSEATSSPNSFEQRMISVERGVRLFGVTILLLASAPNLALTASIETYAASLPGILISPNLLPLVKAVFAHPTYLVILAIVWPIAGSLITLRARDPFRAMVASCIYLILVNIQFAITWFAFVSPIRELVSSMTRQG